MPLLFTANSISRTIIKNISFQLRIFFKQEYINANSIFHERSNYRSNHKPKKVKASPLRGDLDFLSVKSLGG